MQHFAATHAHSLPPFHFHRRPRRSLGTRNAAASARGPGFYFPTSPSRSEFLLPPPPQATAPACLAPHPHHPPSMAAPQQEVGDLLDELDRTLAVRARAPGWSWCRETRGGGEGKGEEEEAGQSSPGLCTSSSSGHVLNEPLLILTLLLVA